MAKSFVFKPGEHLRYNDHSLSPPDSRLLTDKPIRIVLIGARSVRQGTGPFIAAGLAKAGAEIAAVVGTTAQSTTEAVASLQQDWGIETSGYTDLAQALDQLQPDAVAICSPWRFHQPQLQQVVDAGCHCLVEKPLMWPATQEQVQQLISTFQRKRLLLQQVAQWPTTLPAFALLHGGLPAKIERFTMRLSPISIGEDMITDSAPHFVSLLQALAGPGECLDVSIERTGQQLALLCRYEHQGGAIAATLLLETCAQRPRPAWYQVNTLRADRTVQLPEYTQSLTNGERSVTLEDPLHRVTAQFIDDLKAGKTTAVGALLCGHRNLLQLAAAWR